uniref:Uncharacterized protein n=1 Tax=Romanomermis culicivorax TaxID=13658 RepID=A0A915HV53_ROMCU
MTTKGSKITTTYSPQVTYTALSYFAAKYSAAPRGAGCPIHSKKRRRAVLRGTSRYLATKFGSEDMNRKT